MVYIRWVIPPFTISNVLFIILLQIRGEFMRASRILAARPDRAVVALAELCEERKEDLISPPPSVPPRLSPLPPQTPYTVGSFSIRPKGSVQERLSPPTQFFEPGPRNLPVTQVSTPSPPEHMAAKRTKWTCPPPPEAPSADHTLFENQLGIGLKLATAPTEARETETVYTSSSSNSEVLSDEEHPSDLGESDDVLSVRSFTEGSTISPVVPPRLPLWLHSLESTVRIDPIPSNVIIDIPSRIGSRGRLISRLPDKSGDHVYPLYAHDFHALSKAEAFRRSMSGPPRTLDRDTPMAPAIPLPDAPSRLESATVFYQTTAIQTPSPTVLYSISEQHLPLGPQYGRHPSHPKRFHPNHDDPSGLDRRDLTLRGRHRHHEYHVGFSYGTHPRNRPSQSHWCPAD